MLLARAEHVVECPLPVALSGLRPSAGTQHGGETILHLKPLLLARIGETFGAIGIICFKPGNTASSWTTFTARTLKRYFVP